MENYFLEYIIDRKTNTKFEELSELSSDFFYDLSLDFINSLKDNEFNRIVHKNLINEKLKVEYVSKYSDINKRLKKNKTIDLNKLDLNNSAELKRLVESYNLYIVQRYFLKAKYKTLFEEQDQIMNEKLITSEAFKNLNLLLPLISTNLENVLEKFNTDRLKDKRTRKLFETMLKILVRGATKTTPFSSYASISLIKNNNIVEHKDNISKVEINFVILKVIFNALLKNRRFRKHVSYRVSFFNIGKDSINILLQTTNLVAERIVNNVDTFKTFSNNFFYEILLKQLDKKSFKFLDFFESIQSVCKESKIELSLEEIDNVFDSFVETGIIVPDLNLDESKKDVFKEFYNKISYLGENESIIQEVQIIVKKIENLVKKFSCDDYTKRFYYLKRIKSYLKLLEVLLEIKINSNTLVYEDDLHYEITPGLSTIDNETLLLLQNYFIIFDWMLDARILFAQEFFKKYSTNEIKGNNVEIYKLFGRILEEMHFIESDSRDLEVIRVARKSFFNKVNDIIKSGSEEVDIKDFIHAELKFFGKITSKFTNSSTFFLQENVDELVINKISRGYLTKFTRYFKYYNIDEHFLAKYLQNSLKNNLVEIRESFGSNLGVHHPILRSRLLLDTTERLDSDGKGNTIKTEDLIFKYSAKSEMVDIFYQGEPIFPLYMSSVANELLPIQLQFFNSYQTSAVFDLNLINIYKLDDNPNQGERLVLSKIPKVKCGNVVLIRKSYIIMSIFNLLLPIEELYLEIIKKFDDEGLPKRFFVKKILNNYYQVNQDERNNVKSFYIDLASIKLFKIFVKYITKHDILLLEEVYPQFDNIYTHEIQLENTIIFPKV